MKNLAVTEIVRMASVPISAAIRDLVAEMLKSSTYVAGYCNLMDSICTKTRVS